MIHILHPHKKNYCIYLHKDMNGIVFYVGAGSDQRPYDQTQRKEQWHERAKHGYTVEIVQINISSRKEALALEDELIEFYGIDNLVNSGTNKDLQKKASQLGSIGRQKKLAAGLITVSDATRKKMSDRMKGKSPGNKGKTINKITRKFE